MSSEENRNKIIQSRVDRRAEVKVRQRMLTKARDKVQDELKTLENLAYLAKGRGECGGFQCLPSDKAGRKIELSEWLGSDEEYQLATGRLVAISEELDAADDDYSQINFFQKERQVEAAHVFKDSVDGFTKAARNLTAALEMFTSTRPRAGIAGPGAGITQIGSRGS